VSIVGLSYSSTPAILVPSHALQTDNLHSCMNLRDDGKGGFYCSANRELLRPGMPNLCSAYQAVQETKTEKETEPAQLPLFPAVSYGTASPIPGFPEPKSNFTPVPNLFSTRYCPS